MATTRALEAVPPAQLVEELAAVRLGREPLLKLRPGAGKVLPRLEDRVQGTPSGPTQRSSDSTTCWGYLRQQDTQALPLLGADAPRVF